MDNQGLNLKTTGRTAVDEVPYGMYVWETPDGEVLGDGDGNIMNVFCMKGDRKSLAALADAAKYYGHPEGKAVWWSGKRRVNDEELQEQQMRQRLGLIADPLDVGALKDEMRSKQA